MSGIFFDYHTGIDSSPLMAGRESTVKSAIKAWGTKEKFHDVKDYLYIYIV